MASPLKEPPLRLPGQSLNERFHTLFVDRIVIFLFVITLSVWMVVSEWARFYYDTEPHPIPITFVGVVFIVFSVAVISKNLKYLRNLSQGRDGERVVGQLLEELRADGAVVFHDVIGDNFNIDHVIISSKGIFVIETKTWSKDSKKGKISIDGDQLILNGHKLEKDPITQSISEAKWLHETFQRSTGKSYKVTPVVVLPGWFIEKEATLQAQKKGVLFYNPIYFVKRFRDMQEYITSEDVHLAAYHLARYVKSK